MLKIPNALVCAFVHLTPPIATHGPITMADRIPQDPWDAAFAAYNQAMIDLDGDGVPDVVRMPQGQIMGLPRPSDRQRSRAAAATSAQALPDTAGPGFVESALTFAGGPIFKAGGKVVNALMAAPKTTAAGGAAAALATPSEANQENAFDKRMRELTTEQAKVRAEVEKLRGARDAIQAEIDQEKTTGPGPKLRAAQQRLNQWDASNGQRLSQVTADLTAIGGQIKSFEDEYSPAAVRKRNAEMPTKELFPGATMAAQLALAGGGLAASAAMKGRNLGRYNTEMAGLNKGLSDALGRAGGQAEATAMSNAIDKLSKAGPSKAGTLAPTIAGFELGAFAPTFADYYRSGGDPTSPLYKKAVQSVVGGEGIKNVLGYEVPGTDLAARMVMAGLGGVAAGKITNAAVEGVMGRAALPRADQVKASQSTNSATGGAPFPGGPGGVGGGPGQAPQQLPQPGPQGGTGVQPPSPPPYAAYDPAVHGQISRQYLDELLTTGTPTRAQSQALTLEETVPNMVNQLQGRYVASGGPMVDPANLASRAQGSFDQYGALNALLQGTNSQITNPRLRQQVLDMISGRPGMLALPAAIGAGAAAESPVNNLLRQYQGG